MTELIKDKIKFLPKHLQLIHGFVHEAEADLSMAMIPKVITLIILWFYGITVDIYKTKHLEPMTLLIPVTTTHSIELFFANINFKEKMTIGVFSIKSMDFTGVLLLKNGHSYYRNNNLIYEDKTNIISKNCCLKISVNFLENMFSYQINDGQFTNQYMYLSSICQQHSKKGKILFSSPIEFVKQFYYKQNIEYIYIHLLHCNDSISLTNIKRD